MSAHLSLLHSTKNRARFRYKLGEDYKLNPISLQMSISAIEGVRDVRVNAILGNIIILYTKNLKQIEKKIEALLQEEITQGLKHKKEESYLALRSEIPSSAEVARSLTALLLDFVLKNKTAKFGTSAIACAPLLLSGVEETYNHGINSRTLEAMAVAISLYLQDYRTANSTNFMLALGEYIEELTMYKSDDLIKELSKPTQTQAWIEVNKNGKIDQKQVSSDELKIGDIVIVGAGDMILIDGHVVSGEALVNQISMTGEATPVQKARGDKVLSGTVVQEGTIKIWAESVGKDTAVAKIKNYIEETLVQKSSKELSASKMADKLVPITLGLAISSYVFSRDLMRSASVLQADYSCALKLTTPVTFKAAISSAGREGIIVKGAKTLEALQEADTFVFDKTGTLTNGDLEVLDVVSFSDKFSSDQILNLAASIEEHYFHPIAQAIVKAAQAKNFTHIHHDEVTFIVAHGVKSEIEGKAVVIGSRRFLEGNEKIPFAPYKTQIQRLEDSGETLLFIGFDRQLLGVILLKDTIRSNTKEVLARLRQTGVKELIMLTGDSEKKAAQTAKQLGLDSYFAQLLPTEKAEILEDIMRSGKKVAFVGDGVNDAPALIKADVGIGMCKGADITKASADLVLLRDDIEAVAEAKELADICLHKVKRGFNITVVVNTLILSLASLGRLSPIQTAFMHNGTTIALLFNALQRIKLKKKQA